MIIYDYKNSPVEVEIPDKPILAINVTVLSGDETGSILFADGTKLEFDASDCRLESFYDGSYSVRGNERIEAWLNFKPSGNRLTLSYERLDLFDMEDDE